MAEVFTLPKDAPREPVVSKLAKFLLSLPTAKAWRVEVDQFQQERSSQQNRYLNGCCYTPIAKALGYELPEVREFMCGTYWGWREKAVPKKPSNLDGVESVPVRTTTTNEHGRRSVLSKADFADYVAFVQRFAASKGIYIEDPDPNL
jgi:hypothetical protein